MKNSLSVIVLLSILLLGCKTEQTREQPPETLATEAFTNVLRKLNDADVIIVDDKHTGLIKCTEGYPKQHLVLAKTAIRPEEEPYFKHMCRSNIVLKTEYERKPLLAFEEWKFENAKQAELVQLRLNVLQTNLSTSEHPKKNIHFNHWIIDSTIQIVYTRNENGKAYVSTLVNVIKN